MTTPLLYGKRRPAPPAVAAQYVGTDTEMDPKDGIPGNAPATRSPAIEPQHRQAS